MQFLSTSGDCHYHFQFHKGGGRGSELAPSNKPDHNIVAKTRV